MQILRDYQGLCKVLQGSLQGVAQGTPVPPAVLGRRAAMLAESCCLSASPDPDQDAISDCEVILYLVGAFLQAPFWRFEVCHSAWIRCDRFHDSVCSLLHAHMRLHVHIHDVHHHSPV